jgi:hypothetical protein
MNTKHRVTSYQSSNTLPNLLAELMSPDLNAAGAAAVGGKGAAASDV